MQNELTLFNDKKNMCNNDNNNKWRRKHTTFFTRAKEAAEDAFALQFSIP